jgi:hypothetical protein
MNAETDRNDLTFPGLFTESLCSHVITEKRPPQIMGKFVLSKRFGNSYPPKSVIGKKPSPHIPGIPPSTVMRRAEETSDPIEPRPYGKR